MTPAPKVPIIGQTQAAQQAAIMQVYHAMYLGVLPVVAASRMQSGIPDAADPDAIAAEADRIALAGMRRLGVTISKDD